MTGAFRVGVVLGVLGTLALASGAAFDPRRAALAYLVAFAFVASTSVGALVLLLAGYAANARWPAVVRRINEAVANGVLVLPWAFVPIGLSLRRIYPWAGRDGVAAWAHLGSWFSTWFFTVRAYACFAVWFLSALLLFRWSRRHELAPKPLDAEAALGRERAFSSAMLAPVMVAATLAAFDWLMSLEGRWFSSMYGVYFLAGGFLAGLALVTLLAHVGSRRGELPGMGPTHFHALGRLLLAFTIFWAYVAYFQVFLIAIANEAREVPFVLERTRGAPRFATYALFFGHFVLPTLLLVPRAWKLRSGFLAVVAVWLLAMHYVDVHWLVLPAASPGASLHWLDLAALAALGGATLAVVAFAQRGSSLLPHHDPFLAEGLAYRSNT